MRPFAPTLVTTRAARSRVMIGQSEVRSKYSIAVARASHSVVTRPVAMMSTKQRSEKERTLVVVFLAAAVVAAVFLVLAVATLAIVVLCIY